jgi:hypothetical protein
MPNPAISNANQPISSPNPLEAEVLPQLEPDREPDIFDNSEEYVGYDDETKEGEVPEMWWVRPFPEDMQACRAGGRWRNRARVYKKVLKL